MAYQPVDIGAAPNDGTGDPIRDSFDKCNDNFVELYAGLTGLLDLKGQTDCSTNPNYPVAVKGDAYRVSVAGKIGGASGVVVEVGDLYYALADNAGGTQAAVGTSWDVLQGNITGSGIDIEDEGTPETMDVTIINFVGAGVSAADMGGGQVDVTIPGATSGVDIEDEGVVETAGALTINFVGAGVTAADMGGGQVDVTIPGGGYSGGVQSIPILASAMTARTTLPPASGSTETTTNKVMLTTLDFDAIADEFAQFMVPMPKSWNEGTVTAQFIWTAASSSGDVIWGIEAVAISEADPLDAAFGTAQTVTDTLTTALDNHTSAFTSALTIGGSPAEGDLVCFQVYRDANAGGDTLAVDAKLIAVRLNITTNAADDS